MASVDTKVQVLRRTISSLNKWLEASQQLLSNIPMEMVANSQSDWRELALKYKDLLLQIREKCHSIQEINVLYKELDGHGDIRLKQQLAEISVSMAELDTQFANTCSLAKRQYMKLAEKISGGTSSPALSSPATSSPALSTSLLSSHQKLGDFAAAQSSEEAENKIRVTRSLSLSTDTMNTHVASNDQMRSTTPFYTIPLLSSSSSLSGSPTPVTRSLTAPSSPRHLPLPQSHLGISVSCDKLSLSSPASSPVPVSRKAVSSDRLIEGEQWDTLSTQSSSVYSMRSLQNRVISGFGADTASMDSFNSGSPEDSCSNSHGSNMGMGGIPLPEEPDKAVIYQQDFPGHFLQTTPLSSCTSLTDTPQPVEPLRPNKLIIPPHSIYLTSQPTSPAQSPSHTVLLTHPVQQSRQSVQPNQSVQQPNQSVQQPNQSVQTPMQETEKLKTLLACITSQVQDCIHNMTQYKGCALDRTVMEKYIADIKGMLSILETQESVLFQLLATFSPSMKRKLAVDPAKAATPTSAIGYLPANVVAKKDEIVKLSDRVDLLSSHCKQVLAQAEGALAMTTEYGSQAEAIMEGLSAMKRTVDSTKGNDTEECWDSIKKTKFALAGHKQKVAALEQLSLKLFQLEPTFDGAPVRREQESLTKECQTVSTAVTDLLETLAKSRVERFLLEAAEVASQVTMTQLSLDRKSGDKETSLQDLMKDVESHKHMIASFNSHLQDILALVSLDNFRPLQELKAQLQDTTRSIDRLEKRITESMGTTCTSAQCTPEGNANAVTTDHGTEVSTKRPTPPITPPPTPPGYDKVPVRLPALESRLTGDSYDAQTILYDVPASSKRNAAFASTHATLHEDLLRHIAKEWDGLCEEIPSPEDTRNIMDSIGKVPSSEKRSGLFDLVQTLYGMTRSLQDVLAQISAVKIPTLPSLEKIHSRLDECQVMQTHLNTTSDLLGNLCSQSLPLILLLTPRTADVLRLSLLLELRLFDLSVLQCRTQQRLQLMVSCLHRREEETNAMYREVHKLSSTIQEGAKLLVSMDEVTDAAAFVEKCKALYSTLCSLAEKRLALGLQMKEWSVSDPRSAICGRLTEELGNVDREWDRVLSGLSEVPTLEASLFKQMVKNVLKEVVAMEANVTQLQARTLDLKQVTEKIETCCKCLGQAKTFSQSLKAAKKALRDGNSPPSAQTAVPVDAPPPSPIRRAQMPSSEAGSVKGGNGSTGSQKGFIRQPNMVEMVITPRGPALSASTAPQSPAHTRDQCHSVMVQVEQLVVSLEMTLELLKKDKCLLEGFYGDLSDLENWLALMTSSETEGTPKGALVANGMRGVTDQVIARQAKLEVLQTSIHEVMTIPADEEEKKKLERRLLLLYLDWDEVCQKSVPPGVLPLLCSPFTVTLQAPAKFEDASQMLEWLILIESKLQPEKIVVGDFSQLRGMLRMLQVIEREMKNKQSEYLSFMKGEVDTSDNPLSSLPSSKGNSTTPNKCVKFIDENTLQRIRRKQEIKSLVTNTRPGGTATETTSPSTSPLNSDLAGSAVAMSPTASLALDSPTSSLPGGETFQYQLSLLWKGIWTTLTQYKQRLELIQDIWKAFESRKEAMVAFMHSAEATLKNLLPSLNCVKDFEGLDTVITHYKRLTEDVSAHDQKLTTLKSLASNLVNHHHSGDDSREFQATMDAINQRWNHLKDDLSKQQGILEPLSTQWTSFYSIFYSFTQWLNTMDFEMASMNPFVSDMAAIQAQLDKQKEIQQQVTFKEGTLEKIQLQASKLLQGVGGSYLSPSIVHKKLDIMTRTWNHVQKFAKERTTAFEQSLAAKQETMAQLSKCLVWLNQAEKHLASQRPLGADFSQVHTQYEAHQAFWKDLMNQKPQMDSLAASGRFVGKEVSKGKTNAECVNMENTQNQFAHLQERWKALLTSAEQWGELLEKALPEMERLQSLRIECAHRLSDVEAKIAGFEAVSNKFLMLIKQLDSIKEVQMQLDTLGDLMGVANTSQEHLLELGVPPNTNSVEMMSKMASRFGELKQSVTSRHVTIEKAMIRFESNAGMAALPNGWHRAKTEKGTPYYIQASNGNHTQWQHPELSELYREMKTMYTHPFYPTPSYPLSLKLRAIQKKTRFEVLPLQHVVHCYKDNPKGSLTASEMVTYAQAMFQHIEGEFADRIAMSKAIELTTSWIRDVYDKLHEGTISMTSFQIATICMCNGKLDNKYKSLFKVISSSEEGATIVEITNFLQEVVQIPLSCSVTPQNGTMQMITACAQDCFKKYGSAGKLSLAKFLQWVQTEPEPVAWLPILHRLCASDSVQHSVMCTICHMHPIVGFRYRCMDCASLDLCQECYWAGKSTKEHDRSTHYMEEYCIAKEEGKDFLLKALRKSLRKKREGEVAMQDVPSPGPQRAAKGSPAVKKRHSAYVEASICEADELDIRNKPSKGITYQTPPPSRRIATNLLSEPLPSSPPLPIRTRALTHHKNSPTELDSVLPSPLPTGRPKDGRGMFPKGLVTSPPPLLPQPYMTPLQQSPSHSAQMRPSPVLPPPRSTTTEPKTQIVNGNHTPDPQAAVPGAPYNPYGVHTHHRTARVTTTTTVC